MWAKELGTNAEIQGKKGVKCIREAMDHGKEMDPGRAWLRIAPTCKLVWVQGVMQGCPAGKASSS